MINVMIAKAVVPLDASSKQIRCIFTRQTDKPENDMHHCSFSLNNQVTTLLFILNKKITFTLTPWLSLVDHITANINQMLMKAQNRMIVCQIIDSRKHKASRFMVHDELRAALD
ncbi:MAG: hypothetical protein RIG82_01735 [Phycisphaeraceae bacterium]